MVSGSLFVMHVFMQLGTRGPRNPRLRRKALTFPQKRGIPTAIGCPAHPAMLRTRRVKVPSFGGRLSCGLESAAVHLPAFRCGRAAL